MNCTYKIKSAATGVASDTGIDGRRTEVQKCPTHPAAQDGCGQLAWPESRDSNPTPELLQNDISDSIKYKREVSKSSFIVL